MRTQADAGEGGVSIREVKISVVYEPCESESKWSQRRGSNGKAGLLLCKHLLNRASAIHKSDVTWVTSFCHEPVRL